MAANYRIVIEVKIPEINKAYMIRHDIGNFALAVLDGKGGKVVLRCDEEGGPEDTFDLFAKALRRMISGEKLKGSEKRLTKTNCSVEAYITDRRTGQQIELVGVGYVLAGIQGEGEESDIYCESYRATTTEVDSLIVVLQTDKV